MVYASTITLSSLLLLLFPSPVQPQDDGLDKVRFSSGLQALFEMTSGFIDTVQSYTFGQLIDDYNIETIDDIKSDEFTGNWKEWGMHFLGFVACIAAGFLFIICMPIIGCIYGCCRCCGCCCFSSKSRKPTKPSTCWTLVCSGLAVGTSIMMFAVIICAFLTTGMVKNELSEYMLDDIANGIRNLDSYVHDAANDTDVFVMRNMHKMQEDVHDSLDTLPDSILSIMDDDTHVEDSLHQLDTFTASFPTLSDALAQMHTGKIELGPQEVVLSDNINAFKSGTVESLLGNTCDTYVPVLCGMAKDDLATLSAVAIANNLTEKAGVAKIVIDNANGTNEQVTKLIGDYQDLKEEIKTDIDDSVTEIKSQIDDAAESVDGSLLDILDFFDISLTLETAATNVEDLQSTANDVAAYYGAVVNSLTSLLMVTSVLWIIGAIIGTLCGSTGQLHGANMMLAGVSLTFIFSWLLMLVTTIAFAVGGSIDAFACRHLVALDATADSILQVAMANIEDFNYDFNVSVKTFDDCKENASLYNAFRLEDNGFNITELIDLNEYGFYDELDTLKNMTFEIEEIDVITPELNSTMIGIDAALKEVEYEDNLQALQIPVTTVDMRNLKNDLDTIVVALRGIAIPIAENLADDIDTEINALQDIINNDLLLVEQTRDSIKAGTLEAQAISNSVTLPEIINDLNKAQNTFNSDVSDHISNALITSLDEMVQYIENFISVVDEGLRNDLAPCRPLFDAFQKAIYAPCVYFLYPFNALWFTYGWCLFFSIPGLVFATKLTGYYRRKKMYNKVQPGNRGYHDYNMHDYKTTITPGY